MKGIEGIRGTFQRDVILGDKNDNDLSGLAGNDLLDGRGGWDTVRYKDDDNNGGYAGIRANMKTGKIKDGFGTTDTVKNIERVDGTDVRDVFVDSNKRHGFTGRDGDDVFRIYGGDDWMNGDGGADSFLFYGTDFGIDYVGDYTPGEDSLTILAASKPRDLKILSRDDGNDTLVRLNKNAEVYLENVDPDSVSAGDFIA